MFKGIVFAPLLIALGAAGLNASNPRRDTDETLPPEMRQALKSFSPTFELWKAADYQSWIRMAIAEPDGSHASLSTLMLDLNGDKVPDAIVDGHDENKRMLLGLVSTERKYSVHV